MALPMLTRNEQSDQPTDSQSVSAEETQPQVIANIYLKLNLLRFGWVHKKSDCSLNWQEQASNSAGVALCLHIYSKLDAMPFSPA